MHSELPGKGEVRLVLAAPLCDVTKGGGLPGQKRRTPASQCGFRERGFLNQKEKKGFANIREREIMNDVNDHENFARLSVRILDCKCLGSMHV